jgi:hypothetical protein
MAEAFNALRQLVLELGPGVFFSLLCGFLRQVVVLDCQLEAAFDQFGELRTDRVDENLEDADRYQTAVDMS